VKTILKTIGLVAIAALVASCGLFYQNTGSLSIELTPGEGLKLITVPDFSMEPAAYRVTLTHIGSGEVLTDTTTEGEITFPFLPYGTYTVYVEEIGRASCRERV
jgi:hypothetical protein